MNATDDKAEVTRVLADYYKAFSTLDLHAILPYYHQPCLLMSPQGVIAAPTGAEIAASFTPFIEGLRAKGYSRSELSNLRVQRLSATSALATGVAVRYKSDGQELDRTGVTYLLQKGDGGWKFAVVVLHDPTT
jgi:ketosteroid isomerase-like protein